MIDKMKYFWDRFGHVVILTFVLGLLYAMFWGCALLGREQMTIERENDRVACEKVGGRFYNPSPNHWECL